MLQHLLHTDKDFVYLLLRIVAGVAIFPYGMHKLLGWFGDPSFGPRGTKETMQQMKEKHLPPLIGWLVIISQSLGSIALITGFLGRIAAAGNFILFLGALIIHSPDGWALNWFKKKKGEGIEYLVMLLSILLVVLVKGSGPLSIDYLLYESLQ